MEFSALFKGLLNIIFPPLCLACRQKIEDGVLCGGCRGKIETASAFYCPACGRRLPEPKNFCHPGAKYVLAAAASYKNEVVRELIHALKYNRLKPALEPLTDIINEYVEKINGEIKNFILIPIPLHPRKERQRGFNQALLVSEVLSRVLCYSITPEPIIEINNLVRIKKTKSQTEAKGYEERKRNVSGAFSIKRPEAVADKNIILVDDVFTSGATLNEAVRVLKEAGAKKIIGFVVAKT